MGSGLDCLATAGVRFKCTKATRRQTTQLQIRSARSCHGVLDVLGTGGQGWSPTWTARSVRSSPEPRRRARPARARGALAGLRERAALVVAVVSGRTRRRRAARWSARRPDLHRQPRAGDVDASDGREIAPEARPWVPAARDRAGRPGSPAAAARHRRREQRRHRQPALPPGARTPTGPGADAARDPGASRDHQRLAHRRGPDGDQPAAAAHRHQGLGRDLAGRASTSWTAWSTWATT